MMLRYYRRGGRKPPRDHEDLEIGKQGDFTMWRSIGWATYPPSPIGRFAGRLDPAEIERLANEMAEAAAAGNLNLVPKPDAAIETVFLGAVQAKMGAYEEPDGPWGILMPHLRRLLYDLTSKPQAALGLEVPPDGRYARLLHLGSQPLQLELGDLTVRAVLWQEYRKAGDWWAPAGFPGEATAITATPGWSLDLPFDHGFQVAPGQEVVAYVTLNVFDGKQRIPVSLNTPRTGTDV